VKHARADYERIQDPDGKIGDDEPVMLFRGQDELFQEVCIHYAGLLLTRYGPRKAEMAMMVLKHAQLAKQLQQKEPDL
jgi:hypothetical protein